MTITCPHCHRKLLSHSSPRCNWCGHEIADPRYQMQAEASRAVYYSHQDAHDAKSLANSTFIQASPRISIMTPSNPIIVLSFWANVFRLLFWGWKGNERLRETAADTAAVAAIVERRLVETQIEAKSVELYQKEQKDGEPSQLSQEKE